MWSASSTCDRRVADDLEQLLVRPHVVLERRHVEVADHDRRFMSRGCSEVARRAPSRNWSLCANLTFVFGVGDVAAGGHVEILEVDTAGAASHAAVARILAPCRTRSRIRGEERQARQDGDAVIALHAVERRCVAEPIAFSASAGNPRFSTLISCRQMTSGCSSSTRRRSRSRCSSAANRCSRRRDACVGFKFQ